MKPETTESKAAPAAPAESSRYWQVQLEAAEKDHKEFWDRGGKILSRYKSEKDQTTKQRSPRRFNVLYSNTETYMAALYARTPKPDVRRRFADKDQLSRTVADMMERALSYCADTTAEDVAKERAVKDMMLPGRGIVRIDYEPTTTMQEAPEGGQPMEMVTAQKISEKAVYYRDFLHSPARCWADVWWVAFKHVMTKDELRDNEFRDAEAVPLNWMPDDHKEGKDCPDELKRSEVWEIWHKTKRQRVWVVKGHPKILRRDEDPYGLEDFFPMPAPLHATEGNDTYIPVPDFASYEDQADDLDEITARISNLTKALKRRGVYDANVEELKRLARAADNEFIPSKNFAALASKGGLAVAFQSEDIAPIAQVLLALYDQRDRLVQAIYEVTGISDIMRGASDAAETATAQQIKSQFGSMRLKLRQRHVQRWVRDLYRLKAELMAEHYEPQILMEITGTRLPSEAEVQAQLAQAQQQHMMAMQQWQQAAMQAQQTGQQPPPQPEAPQPPAEPPVTIDAVMKVLRDEKLRAYRIDIETDSTVFEDAESEKQARIEMLTAVGGFLQQAVPVAQASPELTPLMFEMLATATRTFKSGRLLEDVLDEARQEITEKSKNPAPPPPDPEQVKLQILQQSEQLKMQVMQQTQAAELQFKEKELAMQMQFESQKHAQQMQFEREKAELAIEVERIKAQAKMQTDQAMANSKIMIAERQAEQTMAHNEAQAEQAHEHAEMSAEQKASHADMMAKQKAKAAAAKPKPANGARP
jgi:hypothetical protein